jgi:hypothetical protein
MSKATKMRRSDCALVRRMANDMARGIETSQMAIAFVRRTCPCASCEVWRRGPR